MATEQALAEQLRRQIVGEITSGSLSPGARLGSERTLAQHYGVSRATLRQVLAALEEAGLVRRVPGRAGGTFISHAKVEHDLSSLVGVPAYLARQGYRAGTRVISARMSAPDAATALALRLAPDALVIDLHRVRLADGTPFSLDHARFPADLFPGFLELPLGGSIYELLAQEYGAHPADAHESVEVVHATDEEATLLGVEPDAALLAITRVMYDQAGRPIEYSYDLLRADRTQITLRTPGAGLRDAEAGSSGVPHFARIDSRAD